jgi:hypothetical protein
MFAPAWPLPRQRQQVRDLRDVRDVRDVPSGSTR